MSARLFYEDTLQASAAGATTALPEGWEDLAGSVTEGARAASRILFCGVKGEQARPRSGCIWVHLGAYASAPRRMRVQPTSESSGVDLS